MIEATRPDPTVRPPSRCYLFVQIFFRRPHSLLKKLLQTKIPYITLYFRCFRTKIEPVIFSDLVFQPPVSVDLGTNDHTYS